MVRFSRFGSMLLCLCLILSLCACGKDSASAPKDNDTHVRIGMLRLANSAPLFIALEKGFFADEGLTVEPVFFEAAQPIAVAVATNELDVGATGLTAGLYNLAAGGQAPLIVADKGRETPEHPLSYLVVTQEAYAQGVHDLTALVGRKIGNTQAGSSFEYMLGNLLERHDLPPDSVQYANLGKTSAVMAALQAQQIDGAILNEPFASMMAQAQYVHILFPVGNELSFQNAAIFYSPQFAERETVALKFLRAYIRACRYYHDIAFAHPEIPVSERLQNDAAFRDLVRLTARYTRSPEEDIAAGLPYIDRNGEPVPDDIARQIRWYRSHEFMQADLDPARVLRYDLWQQAYNSIETDRR
ncbi:MAG: ABC transporter substrate-binding protein [Veillonellaceae bacterium]|nr:ABC transporter substrate-binding protein [Veillonellaceae bacterium]